MLRSIQRGLSLLDNKQVIDTIFSLGKLHKNLLLKEIETTYPLYFKYFNYFVRDLIVES